MSGGVLQLGVNVQSGVDKWRKSCRVVHKLLLTDGKP